jgi:hypothetical protein
MFKRDSRLYRVWISPLIRVSFSFFGDTVGIWMGFFIIKIIFYKQLSWPGIDYFIQDGKILLISFAFFSAALYYATRGLRITLLNFIAGLFLLAALFYYIRAIGSKTDSSHGNEYVKDWGLHYASLIIFFGAIILYYLILLRSRIIETKSDVAAERDHEQSKLEDKFIKEKK